jgi:Zn-dependent peptidase ImmA (M78 family)
VDVSDLRRIFGDIGSATSAEESARASTQTFVRSQDHLALYKKGAKGRKLTAWQAYQAFGIDKLEEVFNYGSAVLVSGHQEPASSLRKSREDRGLTVYDIAKATKLKVNEITNAEDVRKTNPIQLLEKLAMTLGLDETRLSFRPLTQDSERLGIRLRQLKNSNPAFSPNTVIAFDEAAWVIQKQLLLSEWLGKEVNLSSLGFQPDSRYGDKQYPAWQYGYDLARTTRKLLNIKPNEPIESLRTIVETQLKIPLIHLSLPSQFAGATISSGPARGIAVNVNGSNQNVWVRRATIAHELAHLLWDPDSKLNTLVVDTFEAMEAQPPHIKEKEDDFVEARANAFAIEFLAPQEYALELFDAKVDMPTGLRAVMDHFGVSFTSAKFQIWNAKKRSIALDLFSVQDVEPTDEWKGRESFTNDFFKPQTVPVSRRGVFAEYVVESLSRKLISMDSAASFLGCTEPELKDNLDTIRSIFQ